MGRGKRSAGILLFRRREGDLEVFLVHPGGPFFAKRDAGAWSLPKGEAEGDADAFEVALREFAEETGQSVSACAPRAMPRSLGSVRQRGGKVVTAWAVEGDWPTGAEAVSNRFELEWPPGSGQRQSFPEVDRSGFFPIAEARRKINPAQAELLDRLREALGDADGADAAG